MNALANSNSEHTRDLSSRPRSRGRPPKSSGAKTRQALLKAALRHFNDADFADVRMSEIARSAGVTSAAIYNHFSSKDELFSAAVKRMMEGNLEGYIKAASRGETWQDKLGHILRFVANDHGGWTRYPLMISTVQLRLLRQSDAHADLAKIRKDYLELFESIVRKGLEDGSLNPALQVQQTAVLLLAFVANGIGTAIAYNSSEEAIADITDHAAILLGAKTH